MQVFSCSANTVNLFSNTGITLFAEQNFLTFLLVFILVFRQSRRYRYRFVTTIPEDHCGRRKAVPVGDSDRMVECHLQLPTMAGNNL